MILEVEQEKRKQFDLAVGLKREESQIKNRMIKRRNEIYLLSDNTLYHRVYSNQRRNPISNATNTHDKILKIQTNYIKEYPSYISYSSSFLYIHILTK